MQHATPEDLRILREGGRRLATLMDELTRRIDVGVSTLELDTFARTWIEEHGDIPAFLDYRPDGAQRAYPATLCTSVNEHVVHGIPNEDPHVFDVGDIVTLDCGLIHEGRVVDTAVTIGVGTLSEEKKRLMQVAREALGVALSSIKPGATTGDVGHAVRAFAEKHAYTTPEELGGHGVGLHVHEEPFIPNVGVPGEGTVFAEGMVLAVEPIVMEGSGDIVLESDGYTYISSDGGLSAQFEHTVYVGPREVDILTRM